MESTRTVCVAAVPSLDANRVPEIIGAVTVLTILATIAVVLRFFARSVQSAQYGYDDWLMVVALIGQYIFSAIQYLAVQHGFGHHILMLDVPDVVMYGKLFFTDACIFPIAMTPLKLSILWFYHRIFPIRKFTISCIAIAAVTVAWLIASLVAQFLLCRPFQYFWDKSIPGGTCINIKHVAYFITSPPDILTSIAILILPIPSLWGLQMQRRRKLAISGIFLLASLSVVPSPFGLDQLIWVNSSVVGSVIRVPLLAQLNTADASYSTVSSGLWLNVEISIGIFSACLPLLRPLVSRAFPSQIRSRFSKSRTGSQRLQDLEANGKISGSGSGNKLSGSKSGNSGSKSGGLSSMNKERLEAGGGKSAHAHVRGLSDEGIYAGQNRKQPHRGWLYNVGAGGGRGSRSRGSEQGSEEDMVPMGKIQVRHEVEWERQGEGESDERGDERGEGKEGIGEGR
ncbi:MAG: hypothetical protein Q9192_004995 [Flavoplaca navasiana]